METLMRTLFLIVILALAACTINPEPTAPAIDTDTIAGYWSGNVAGKLDTGKELPPGDVGILLIAGCVIDKVCGKYSEDGHCPGDIILSKVDGNIYFFIVGIFRVAKIYHCAAADDQFAFQSHDDIKNAANIAAYR